ncbi:hypothetical protein ACJ73_06404 [Blastomyces percursus]|uniref:Uncharacterized protein n=1 Tax=Blastomyces percursus TaxID=1658174 RepID=A0A1J9R3R2_9EURO|nr:hypothetical protein ACJ73_06404 [Blastomyces percursus]
MLCVHRRSLYLPTISFLTTRHPSCVPSVRRTPSLDVEEINDDSLHLTVVAQVLAFTLRALVSRKNGMMPSRNLASGRLNTRISWSKHLQPLGRSMPHLCIGDCNHLMLVDFERAEMRNALSAISPNLWLKRRRLGKNISIFSAV